MKNVIFILSDQHNAKFLGIKHHLNAKTPYLDALAKDGILFDNAQCPSPICTPSRVSWISGQYCHNHGYYGLEGENPHGLPTVFGHFRNNGYRTGAIGKIHCPEYWVEDDCDTFIEARGCSIGKSPEYTAYNKANGFDTISDEKTIAETGYNGNGQIVDGLPSRLNYAQSQERYIVDESISFIKKSVQDEKPFFLHTSFGKPHQPYIPAKEFWDMYPDEEIVMPENIDYDSSKKAPHLRRMQEYWTENQNWIVFEPKDKTHGMRRKLRGYLGCVTQVDYAVGELVEFLKKEGLYDNTIIVYSSDHGDYACEHGLLEKAPGICSDAICRIPLIVRYPGGARENVILNDVVEAIDIVPTLCNLVGIDELETADGKALSELFKDENAKLDDDTLALTEFAWSKSLRKGAFRFVYYPKKMFNDDYPEGFCELYNVENDPWEMNNLFFDKNYATMISEFKEDLTELLITTARVKTVERTALKTTNQRKFRYGKGTNADNKFSVLKLTDEEKLKVPPTENYL